MHFLAAGTATAGAHVQVREGSHIGRETHASARAGSDIGQQMHEAHPSVGAAVAGMNESRTSGSENFQDGWAQKISRIPTQKKFA
ncbi:MAG TPA: hypothetical protein VNM90_05265 [Haliangium sp.]|nr:hypothetical protein [Haliangium sp.]